MNRNFPIFREDNRIKLVLSCKSPFDRVRVREHPEVPAFAELEVELLSGDPAAFCTLAVSLETALGYPASTESKLARALRFVA